MLTVTPIRSNEGERGHIPGRAAPLYVCRSVAATADQILTVRSLPHPPDAINLSSGESVMLRGVPACPSTSRPRNRASVGSPSSPSDRVTGRNQMPPRQAHAPSISGWSAGSGSNRERSCAASCAGSFVRICADRRQTR